jgi:hypothetical protein
MIGWLKRKKCRERNAVIKVFLDETGTDAKFKYLDHIFNCPQCSRDFDALLEVWRGEESILKDVEKKALTKEKENRIRKLAAHELKKLKARRGSGKLLPLSPPKILAAAAGIIAVVLISWFSFDNPGNIVIERNSQSRVFDVIAPIGPVADNGIVFRWNSIEEARTYSLEILDQGLEPFYRSRDITQNRFTLPGDIFSRLEKNKNYYWKVIAEVGANQKIESELGKFTLPSEIP